MVPVPALRRLRRRSGAGLRGALHAPGGLTASITSDVGSIFHPLFWVFAQALALFYSLIPNYIIAITLLTVLVMLLTAPLTVKSTKSMVEMQRIQPEFRKLQQKYKGDREKMNEEVMKLYREHGVSPVGGCLPLLLQMPFFVCLYGVIKGLTNYEVGQGASKSRAPLPFELDTMYQDIVHAGGKIKSFGIDLSQTPFTHHGSIGASIPYYVLFFAAIGLQYHANGAAQQAKCREPTEQPADADDADDAEGHPTDLRCDLHRLPDRRDGLLHRFELLPDRHPGDPFSHRSDRTEAGLSNG